jgi:hypothetical protein
MGSLKDVEIYNRQLALLLFNAVCHHQCQCTTWIKARLQKLPQLSRKFDQLCSYSENIYICSPDLKTPRGGEIALSHMANKCFGVEGQGR